MPGDKGPSLPSTEPVSVPIGSLNSRMLLTTAAVLGVIGAYVIFSVIVGGEEDGGSPVVSLVFGYVMLLLTVGAVALWWRVVRPRRLVVDEEGLRRIDPRGRPWAVEWSELAQVTLSFGRSGPGPGEPAPTLELRPADRSFQEAHPTMEHWAIETPDDPGVYYRMPLNRNQRFAEPVHNALASFALGIYRPQRFTAPEGRRRPVTVMVCVPLLAVAWLAAMVYAVMQAGDAQGIAIGVVWVLAVGAWLVRVWAGGPMAIQFMVMACTWLGAILLGFSVLFTAMGIGGDEGFRDELEMFVPMALAGLGLLLPGRLLARKDVREWAGDTTG